MSHSNSLCQGLLLLALAALAPASASAQEVIFDSCHAQEGARYGHCVDYSEAVDAMGRAVMIIGAPYFTSPAGGGVLQGEGAVFFSSGASPLVGEAIGDEFGYALEAALRLDGQGGRDDLLVAAPGKGAGEVFAYSGAGALLHNLSGVAPGDRLGERVARIGDIDDDGFDDFLAAAPTPASGQAGYVFAVSGHTGTVLRVHVGLDGSEGFGSGICELEDIDGDATRDYAIGIPGRANAAGIASGVVQLISGADGALLSELEGVSTGEAFGFSVTSGADLDRDGVEDLAVGMPGAGGDDGAVRAFSLASGEMLFQATGDDVRGRFGHAITLARDFDGDGHGDVVVGGPSVFINGYPRDGGVAAVISGASGETLMRFGGGYGGAGAGVSVAAGQDYDGDGLSDVIVGGVNNSDGYSSVGCVFILGGGPATPTIKGKFSERAGAAVDGAGDLDADGVADILVGAPDARDASGTRTGAVQVRTVDGRILGEVFGPAGTAEFGRSVVTMGDLDGDGFAEFAVGALDDVSVYSGAPGFPLRFALGGNGSPRFGSALASGRDVDGDGVNDLVVGLSPCASAGSVVVFSGATGGRVLEFDAGTGSCESFGASVALVDDIDGDGRAEIAVGIPDRDVGAPFFAPGSVDLRSGLDGSLLHSYTTFNFHIGTALARVGDLDGDGFSDLVASWWDPQSLQTWGGIDVLSGATLSPLWTVTEVTSYSGLGFGYALDSAGDFDGDGFDDVIVGSPGQNRVGARASGAAYIYSGASGTRLADFPGSNGWDYLGYSVAGLGDVDGDGQPDVAMGAPTERSNNQGATPGLNRVRIGLSDPLLARNYCPLSAAGAGNSAVITASGSGRVSASHLDLTVANAAGPSFGIFVVGQGTDPSPFLGGWNCIGSGWTRLTGALQTSSSGALTHAVDFASPGASGLVAGTSHSFQFWFRDAVVGVGTTDAVRVTFLP